MVISVAALGVISAVISFLTKLQMNLPFLKLTNSSLETWSSLLLLLPPPPPLLRIFHSVHPLPPLSIVLLPPLQLALLQQKPLPRHSLLHLSPLLHQKRRQRRVILFSTSPRDNPPLRLQERCSTFSLSLLLQPESPPIIHPQKPPLPPLPKTPSPLPSQTKPSSAPPPLIHTPKNTNKNKAKKMLPQGASSLLLPTQLPPKPPTLLSLSPPLLATPSLSPPTHLPRMMKMMKKWISQLPPPQGGQGLHTFANNFKVKCEQTLTIFSKKCASVIWRRFLFLPLPGRGRSN